MTTKLEPVHVRRRFSRDPDPRLDDLGFLDPKRTTPLLGADELLKSPVALIVAPHWMGKSFVAKQLDAWLRQEKRFEPYLRLTGLEIGGAEHDLLPDWWNQWRNQQSGTPACWVIDSLDEGEQRHGGLYLRIAQKLKELSNSQRADLRLVMLSRPREWIAGFAGELQRLYPDQRVLYGLAPLDQREAAELLGGEAEFERVAEIIGRCGLARFAGYPTVLRYLKGQPAGSDLDVAKLWRGILTDLLKEHQPHRTRDLRSELEDRFDASARIAVVLTLSGCEEVGLGNSRDGAVALDDIFPMRQRLAWASESRRTAARESCDVGPFVQTSSGGRRFADTKLRQFFCAYGLSGLPLRKLSALLSDFSGNVHARHRDMVEVLSRVSSDPEVRRWGESVLSLTGTDGSPWSLAEALRRIDRLEQLAKESPVVLRVPREDLARLATPGLGTHLSRRLADRRRSSKAKEVLLDVAQATDAREAVASALAIVLDTEQDTHLRQSAVFAVRDLGSDADLKRLEQVATSRRRTAADAELRATIVYYLLERGLWSIPKAARHAPPRESVIDFRATLLHTLTEKMGAEDAAAILTDLPRFLGRVHGKPADGGTATTDPKLTLAQAAIDRLLKEASLTEAQQLCLARAALALRRSDHVSELVLKTRRLPTARRELYSLGRQRQSTEPNYDPGMFRFVLTADDLEWLLEQVPSCWSAQETAWQDLYNLAAEVTNKGRRSRSLWARVHTMVKDRFPAIIDQYKQGQRERVSTARTLRRVRRSNPEPKTYAIGEVVDELLADTHFAPGMKMRRLAWVCLSSPWVRPSNLSGEWTDLSDARQEAVLRACRDGLERGTPTPIPEGDQFPASLFYEAAAFGAVVSSPVGANWINGDRIRSWLPACLRAAVNEPAGIVRICLGTDSAATSDVVIEAIVRELKVGKDYAHTAARIPVEMWPGQFAERIASLLRDFSYPPQSRAALLRVTAMRQADHALRVAIGWSQLPGDCEANGPLRQVGVDCRLALQPDRAWPLVEADFQTRGVQALLELPSLWNEPDQCGADVLSWPAERLTKLARMLLQSFPLASAPVQGGWVGPKEELVWLREKVLERLLYRGHDGDEDGFLSLVDLEPSLRNRHAALRARREANATISRTAPPDQPLLPVERIVELLDNADYRLVRSDDDLLEAVLETLGRINNDIGDDLAMLYARPARARSRGTHPSRQRPDGRRHLEEDALQTYVRRRLVDLLPRVVDPGERVELLREDQVRHRRRLDLRVLAPCLDGKQACVIIEMKWSDNRKVGTSLTDQLGTQYLLGEERTHGVYLVGWCGLCSWTRNGKRVDRQELPLALEHQAKRFCQRHKGKGIRIEPFVLDAGWREDAGDDEKSPRHKSQSARSRPAWLGR
jgi:hypothetical protein